jgi:stress response protein SCP2
MNMLGDFEVEALEHDESIEDADFLKVTIEGCGPCAHRVTAFNGNKYGLQESSGDGHACGQKADDQCPPAASKFGSSYGTWYFTTKKFDSDVKPMLDVVNAEMELSRVNGSSELSHETYWDLQELIARIRDQEVKFPFNHKLERMQLSLQTCKTNAVNRVSCSSVETRYTHDAMLMRDSAEKMMIEYVKASPSDKAPPYGPLEPTGTRDGLSFSAHNAALKGGINWHVALVKYGQCTPAMQEWLFVGIGSDSDVDMDLGLVFWRRSGSTVEYKDHVNYAGSRIKFRGAVEYSGDNRNGAGEGDDEWMALNLRALRQQGIDYVTVHVNLYSGETFSKLEGAFLRFAEVDEKAPAVDKTMDPKTEKELRVNRRHPMEEAKTVQYMDLDAAKGALGNAKAGLMSVLFTSPDSQKALPPEAAFSLPQGDAHFQIVQVGKPMSSESLHNSTSQREIKNWWSGLQETTLADKKSVMNPVDAYELGQETKQTDLLNELPGGRDPLTNEIAVEDVRHDPPVLLTPLDKELKQQSVHMTGEDKYILEDTKHGICIHLRQGKDFQPELFMDNHCGTGGKAVEWRFQMGDNGGTIPQADVDKCMVPSGTGVVLSPECEVEWKIVPVHGGTNLLQQTTSGQCLGYADPAHPIELIMTACNSPHVAKLHKMLAIKGLFDNLLVEFPGGPPGTESLCLKNR